MNYKVSVIIPIYNAIKYLEVCVNSVLMQTEKNIEVILIDDGSTDGSGDLCDLFEKKDSRIKVIHQKNSGVSVSRNKGLSIASGKWIMFVDSDDWLDSKALESLLSCENPECELIIGPIINNYSLTDNEANAFENKIIIYTMSEYKNDFIGGCIIEPRVFPRFFKHEIQKLPFLGSPCGKLYKNNIIQENNVIFNKNITYGEDSFFNLDFLEYVNNVKYIETPVYFYRMRPGSLSTGRVFQKFEQYNQYVDEIYRVKNMYKYKNFDEFLSVDLTQMVWELSEMYGMSINTLKDFIIYRKKLKIFASRYECATALDSIKISYLPDLKHKIIVFCFKLKMYGMSILGCHFFYKIYSKKNRIKYEEV